MTNRMTSTGMPLEMDLDDGPIVSQIVPVADIDIELCSHVCPRCGSCDRCCDGHEDSDESEQR